MKSIERNANVVYAREELRLLAKNAGDRRKQQEQVNHNILNVIRLFVEQGNNDQDMYYIMQVLQRLLSFKPLSPLWGTSGEWKLVETTADGHMIHQNRRCPSVYRIMDKHGSIVDQYDLDAIVLSADGGVSWFTSPKFVKRIKFPYTVPEEPKEVYVKDVEGAYQIVTDKEEIKRMYDAAIALEEKR